MNKVLEILIKEFFILAVSLLFAMIGYSIFIAIPSLGFFTAFIFGGIDMGILLLLRDKLYR